MLKVYHSYDKGNIRLWRFADGGAGDELIEQIDDRIGVAGMG